MRSFKYSPVCTPLANAVLHGFIHIHVPGLILCSISVHMILLFTYIEIQVCVVHIIVSQ